MIDQSCSSGLCCLCTAWRHTKDEKTARQPVANATPRRRPYCNAGKKSAHCTPATQQLSFTISNAHSQSVCRSKRILRVQSAAGPVVPPPIMLSTKPEYTLHLQIASTMAKESKPVTAQWVVERRNTPSVALPGTTVHSEGDVYLP